MHEPKSDEHPKILQLWEDPQVGLTGLARFRNKLQAKGIRISTKDLKDVLESRGEHTLFQTRTGKARQRARLGNQITESAVGVGIQIDLMDMSMLATRNKNYHWILVAIDVYSRKAWAVPVKRKSSTEMKKALLVVLKHMKKTHKRVTSDEGVEFTNASVQTLFRKYNLIHYTSQNKTNTAIVERFIRTLRDLMGRNFQRIGKLHWVQYLEQLLKNYNHSVHRTLKATPEDVWNGAAVAAHSQEPPRRVTFPFREGDLVRVWLQKNIFDKRAGALKWSANVFTVARREGFHYVIKNAKGEELKTTYKPSHLQKVTRTFANGDHSEVTAHQKAQEKARKARQKQAFLQRQGLLPATRTARFRPSRTRRRPRTR